MPRLRAPHPPALACANGETLRDQLGALIRIPAGRVTLDVTAAADAAGAIVADKLDVTATDDRLPPRRRVAH